MQQKTATEMQSDADEHKNSLALSFASRTGDYTTYKKDVKNEQL
jgi:hypothetical protein